MGSFGWIRSCDWSWSWDDIELSVDEVIEIFFFVVLDSIFGVFDEDSDLFGDGIGSEHFEVIEIVTAGFEEFYERMLLFAIEDHFSLIIRKDT